jgi:MoxR-like ATPase
MIYVIAFQRQKGKVMDKSNPSSLAMGVIKEVQKSVIGKNDAIIKTFLAILSGGHILIEDIPGVGKTTMAVAFSKALGLSHHRVQFTPDVMPSDITGFSIYRKDIEKFEFQEGAAMCNLLLADEINRTSPKTQSALLEAMEEGNVTVDGKTYYLPKPFIVIATENPYGSAGTQPLPLSQLDRFMVCISMGYPTPKDEAIIVKSKYVPSEIHEVLNAESLMQLRQLCNDVYIHDAVIEYIISLVNSTRKNESIKFGVSPRGTVAVVKMAKSLAFLHGRDYVVPEDVDSIFAETCVHRIVLDPSAELAGKSAADILHFIIREVKKPTIEKKS